MTSMVIGSLNRQFSELLQIPILSRLKKRTSRDERLSIAFAIFSNTHKRWQEKGLDHNFFELRVKPMINLYEQNGALPSADDIALAWDEDFGCGQLQQRKETVAALATELHLLIAALKLAIR